LQPFVVNPPPLKRLGQHFLTDPAILSRIVDALEPGGQECVVEIGAGRGSLTEHLASRFRRVIAVEIDRMLIPILRERFADRSSVEMVEGNALLLSLSDLAGSRFKLVGNVPYYITTPLIFHALSRPRAELAVFLVQREVAERAAALPGSEGYGALSVNLQVLAEVEVLFSVPRGAFQPRPRVDSALLRLRPRASAIVPQNEEEAFQSFVQGAFARRRKQMKRVLRGLSSISAEESGDVLLNAGIDPEARPESLTPREFHRLFVLLRKERS
jgi:16S rRNA (adenine1518-N6/adenine1519-N6)-dimethyltransferase